MASRENKTATETAGSNENAEDGFSSSFASIRGVRSVCETSRQTMSSSVLTVKGFQSEDGNVLSDIAEADVSCHSSLFGEVNRTEVNISKEKIAEQCLKCRKVEATHFCNDCRHRRQYMCYICLKDHNHWHEDHDVVTLSVKSEGNLELPAKDLNRTGISKVADLQQLERFQFQQLPSKSDTDGDQNERKNIIKDMSTRSPKTNEIRKPSNPGRQVKTTKFYHDKLLLGIAQEELGTKQRCLKANFGKLQKYGMYSIRTRFNTKTCAVTGIVQLDNKKLLLADSENSELKIMNEENFKIIMTQELPSNPYLVCFVKENTVIIACINYEFYLVDLNCEIDIQILFEIKHLFKGIACASHKLFGCTSDTVEVYNDTGKQISKFKPVDVTNIEDMCVSKEGDVIYCADEKKGIVVLNKHGTVVDIISENLCQPYRLCHGHQGYIFVTEKNSDRVMQIDIQRKKVKQIGKDECFTKDSPVSLCHEKRNNRLIVAVWLSDEVHVYTCL